jgi:DNA-binding NtrC family response regulator
LIPRQANRLAILLVDRDDRTRRALLAHLALHEVIETKNYMDAAAALIYSSPFDIVLAAEELGANESGADLLDIAKQHSPAALRILMVDDDASPDRSEAAADLIERKTDIGFIRMLGEL